MQTTDNTSYMLLSLVIGFGVIMLLLLATPKISYAARGVFLPSKHNKLQPYTGQIAVFKTLPSNYQHLGTINIERHDNGDATQATKDCFLLAKRLAAQHGANAIVITTWGHTAKNDPNFSSYILMVNAIRTEGQL